MPPGTPLPVSLTVQGAPADAACVPPPASAAFPGQSALDFEPPVGGTAQLRDGTCSVMYSAYRTPTLVAATATAPAGVEAPALNGVRVESAPNPSWVVRVRVGGPCGSLHL